MARTWRSVLARMGTPTGDGRILDPAGAASRDLPLPLSWQQMSGDGHGGSQIVARIESLSFDNGMVTASGTMLDSAPYEVYEQIEAGVIGPSVDLDDIEYVMDESSDLLVLTKWRVAGATLVSIPAFAEVSITLDPEPAEPMEASDPAEPHPIAVSESLFASAVEVQERATSVLPPIDWFTKPDLDRLTPLTVSDTGRVFGHIAGWESCHVGLPGCVTPPPSYSNYSYFLQSSQTLSDGTTIPVGTLVAGPRHADAQLAFHAATQHYDDPLAAVARVMAGEDEFGIWVAGWVLPHAAPQAKETFMSSPVSGDWRRVGGNLELIAVCSVNSAGFPIPKARVAFSAGHQRTLIGTFGMQPVKGDHFRDTAEVTDADTARAKWAWAQMKGTMT